MKTNLLIAFILLMKVAFGQPPCGTNPAAGNTCATATPICELNGYCGNTSSSYTANTWGNSGTFLGCGFLGLSSCPGTGLTGTFCGSIENNSFLSFTASATTLSFNLWVTSSTLGYGIQILIFSANNCSGNITQYGPCYDPGTVQPGPVNITANGLTVGNTYYIMIDGNAGDVCNYVIGANSGVSTPVNVNPTSATICSGQTVALTASSGNGTYTWNANPQLNTTTGANVVATPPGPGTYTYTVNSSGGNPLCPSATSASAIITVNNCGCTVVAGNSGPVCSGGNLNLTATTIPGATYAWTGPSGYTSTAQNPTGVIPPTTPGTYTYTVTATLAGVPCTSSTTITVQAPPTANANIDQSICAGGTINLNGTIGGTSSTSTWSAPSGTFSNANSLTSIYTPIIASGSVTLTLTTNTTGLCPVASDQMVVTVISNVSANANSDQTVCAGGSITLAGSVGNGATTGTWSAPSGTFSNVNSFTSTYTPTITSGSVNLTLTSNVIGSCPAASDVMVVTIQTLPTTNANVDQSVCAGSSVNLNGIVGNGATTGSWTAPSGTFSNNSSLTSSYTPTLTTGSVTLTLTSNVVGVCPSTSDQMVVNIIPNVSANANLDQSVCSGGTINLAGAVGNGATTGTWTAGSGVFSNATNLNSTYTPSIATGTVTLTLTSNVLGGCPAAVDNMIVTVISPPTANANVDQTVCAGGIINLNGIIGGGATSGTWTAPSGALSNGTSLTSTYTPSITSGIVTLTLTANSGGICPNTTDQMDINVIPVVTSNANIDQTICAGETVMLSGSIGGSATNGTWSAPSGSFANASNLSTVYTPTLTSGTVVLTLTASGTGTCPTAGDVLILTINPNPTISAGNDVSICEGSSVTLTGSGGSTYAWDNGIANGVSFYPSTNGTYTVTGTSSAGCISTDQVQVTVNPRPTINFTPDLVSGCAPLTVNFTNSSTNTGNCIWQLSDGSTINGCGNFTHTFTNPGCYSIALTGTSSGGCTSSLNMNNLICIEANPVADFTTNQSEISEINSEVQFTNNSIGATSYNWNFGDNSGASSATDPFHSYQNQTPGTFIITLIAQTAFGCSDTTTKTIVFKDELIYYIPNTFTPDGDEYNQYFLPLFTAGIDIYNYTFEIYNRWGEVVFESHNIENGWNGTYGNSSSNINIVQDGVYTYRIAFKVSSNDERKIVNGHVNLIR